MALTVKGLGQRGNTFWFARPENECRSFASLETSAGLDLPAAPFTIESR